MNMPKEDTSTFFEITKCTELLSQLVEIDTSQPDGNEARLVDFIMARYKDTPAICTRIDHEGKRASLVVKLIGKSNVDTVAFVGHLDTVSCGDPAFWNSPPLSATVNDGILVARGAADMKGGIASMLLVLDRYIHGNIAPNGNVLFCFTADEEKEGIGARALIQSGLLKDTRGVIICEPTRNSIGICEKGALWIRVTATGVASHASRPELGANAIDALFYFASQALTVLDLSQAHKFLGKNTLTVTQFHGGNMTNIVPASAFMEVDIRTLPGVSHEKISLELREICREIEATRGPLALELEVINNRPPLEIADTNDFVLNVQACAQKRGMPLEKRGLFFYTDASQLIPALDVPFVIMGPGDDKEAHKTNERINISSVALFAELYASYIEDYC